MNILSSWHRSLDIIVSRQLFSFIKDNLCAIGRTYFLTIKYFWWLFSALLIVEGLKWIVPFGYESLFFTRAYQLSFFAGSLLCSFIMICAAGAKDRHVSWHYFSYRFSYFGSVFFFLIIVQYLLLFSNMWIYRFLSLIQMNNFLTQLIGWISILIPYLALYVTTFLASAFFVFFILWLICDDMHGIPTAINRAINTLVCTYPLCLLAYGTLWLAYQSSLRLLIIASGQFEWVSYLWLLDIDLLFAPCAVGLFATIFTWHIYKKLHLPTV
jgi:hypothetical protein